MTRALPNVVGADLSTPFDHRLAGARSTRGNSGLSRAGDAHVIALRAMFDAIRHTMDEYAALLTERGKQFVADTGVTDGDGGAASAEAADACAEMARVADKWLRFVESTALRDARRRTTVEEVARSGPVLEW